MLIPPLKYVVGIGASAGGLEAIQRFFNNMTATDKLSFIIVQHLTPDYVSMMSDLLAHNTSMPIISAKNKMKLQSGVIYLVPAGFQARVKENQFILSKINRKFLSLPINTLFESLALAYKENALGIILSGTGSDGSLGISAIARNGGLTIAETPFEAKFADMPNSAIATKDVHCVLSLSEMPDVVMEYISQPGAFNKEFIHINPHSKSEYNEIFHLLERKYKINFAAYKLGTVSRRIQRRMQLLGIDNVAAYVSYLTNDAVGVKTLYQDLLIGVTEFFRDPEAFAILETEVIPELYRKYQKTNEDIRIWINPCATGEEAYSVAILFKKYADEHNLPFAVRIFASDVCSEFIQKAKKGSYPYKSVAQLSTQLLDKYFIKSADFYEVIPEIKQKVLFTTHNLLKDPPFTKMDLVCCRNFLIYINTNEQKRVTDILRFSINIGGYLFLGPSEGISSTKPELIVKNQLWKIFKKFKRSNFPVILASRLVEPLIKDNRPSVLTQTALVELPLYAYNAVLQDIVSAGFIIDASYTLLHCIGKAREMVMFPEGVPNLILPKIIVDDLKGGLIAALHEAKTKLVPVIYNNIPLLQNHEKQRMVSMAVHPICDTNDKVSYFWIRIDPSKPSTKKQGAIIVSNVHRDMNTDEIIIGLEEELSETRSLLQTSLESMETISEEMQSTNEELMASNEELQSTNEELQSVNEELYTVNLERSKKIEEVFLAKSDIDNLIRGAEICTIILNKKLEIRIFTPAAEKIFNLVSHDIGRPLINFKHNLKFDLLMAKADDVLKNNKAYEGEVKNNQNHWYFLKITPYSTAQNQEPTGVVITLTDINDTKLLRQEKEEVEKDLLLALKTGLIGIWKWNIENDTFILDGTIKTIFGLNRLSDIRCFKEFIAAIHPDDRKRLEKAIVSTQSKKETFEQNFRIVRPDKSLRYLSCAANLHYDIPTNSNYITGICWDMTEQYWLGEKIIDAEHLLVGLDAITDGWWDWNLVSNEAYLSPMLKNTLGYEDHELVNSMENYEQLMYPDDLKMVRNKMKKYFAANSTQPLVETIRMKHKSGSTIWILSRTKGIVSKSGKLIRIVGAITDLTVLKENEAALKQLAYLDFLTQIPNRPAFLDALFRAIERSQRNQSIMAVLYIDIDDFKEINDTLGHSVGDTVLREFTKRLLNVTRTVDLLARIGGDEFGVIVEDIVSEDEVHVIATRYISAFTEPLKVNDREVLASISIGVALYPKDGKTDQEILKHADRNMYAAKKLGKKRFVL